MAMDKIWMFKLNETTCIYDISRDVLKDTRTTNCVPLSLKLCLYSYPLRTIRHQIFQHVLSSLLEGSQDGNFENHLMVRWQMYTNIYLPSTQTRILADVSHWTVTILSWTLLYFSNLPVGSESNDAATFRRHTEAQRNHRSSIDRCHSADCIHGHEHKS